MANSKYHFKFEFEDFVELDEFRDWVLAPTKERDEFWDDFLKANPEKQEEIEEAREFLLDTRTYFESNNIEESEIHIDLGRVLERTTANRQTQFKPKLQISTIYRPMAAAAAMALLLGFFGWYVFGFQSGLRTYVTDFAEWKTLQLPDGSEVKLNANSELILAEDWSEGATRQVWLKGEAFFSVSKKPATHAKFQVITDDLTVEVLGTEFNVLDRGEQTEIFLKEGKISLDMGEMQETLTPGFLGQKE